MTPKLTIGMATYAEPDHVWWTINGLRLYHDLSEVEILVIDNRPDGDNLRKKVESFSGKGCALARYIAMPEPVGTSPPRNRVFAEASAPFVVCLDSHVFVAPGSVARLIDYFAQNPETSDLVTGPIMHDTGMPSGSHVEILGTHFDDSWRAEMWGIWAQAWRIGATEFTVRNAGGLCRFASLAIPQLPLELKTLPDDLPHAGHERVLEQLGAVRLGVDPADDFEIPAQGLGLFACRKAAWPGFNPHSRGFGGEEHYIHEKVRRRGGRCRCLGFLKWWHLFRNQNGRFPYPNKRYDKIRNYSLELLELGLPLDRMREHFAPIAELKPRERELLRIEQSYEEWAAMPDAAGDDALAAGRPPQPAQAPSLDEIFTALAGKPRDLDKHMPLLRELAGRCEHVSEISHRRESFLALLAGGPSALVSHNTEADDSVTRAAIAAVADLDQTLTIDARGSDVLDGIEPTDLLFIDSIHTAERLGDELRKFAPAVRRYIVLHDTQLYGEKGEDGGPGLLGPLRTLVQDNDEDAEWFICHHTDLEYGLTVLSRDPRDKPPAPFVIWDPGYGPGTELTEITEQDLQLKPPTGCTCKDVAKQMDRYGVEGCRKFKDQFFGEILKNYELWGWKDKLQLVAAGKLAKKKKLRLKIDPLHPIRSAIESCYDLAVDRAEEKERAKLTAEARRHGEEKQNVVS